MRIINIHGNLFFFTILLIGCSRGIDDVPLQKRYKMAYAQRVCSTMNLFVDKYKNNPLEMAWTYSQGIATVERRDEYVLSLSMIGLRSMTIAYEIPSGFSPNPSSYSINEIASSCPKSHSEFMRIPF